MSAESELLIVGQDAAGKGHVVLTDSAGRILTGAGGGGGGTSALSWNSSQGVVKDQLLIVGAPATLYHLVGRNHAAARRFVMLFDAAAVGVANGTSPLWEPVSVDADTMFGIYVPEGIPFPANGIVVASSTTDVTLTTTGAPDVTFTGGFLA